MNWLAVDTSTSLARVALFFAGKMWTAEQDNIRTHAKFLLPMIDGLLQKGGCSLTDLDGLIVGRGPGSFTGLRIAVSHVKGLAFAHDLPIYPVSGLMSIAYAVFQSDTTLPEHVEVLTTLDARMHQMYWASYSRDLTGEGERVTSASDVVVAGDTPLVIAGVEFEAYLSELPAALLNRVIDKRRVFPSVTAMIAMVESGLCAPVSAEALQPIYIRDKVVS